MVRRYVISFLSTLLVFSAVCSTLPFATRSRVRAGTSVQETWTTDFTLDTYAASDRYYSVDDQVRAALPRIFLPSPIVEWTGWNLTLLIIGFVGCIFAGLTVASGFMSSGFWWVIVILQLAGLLIGLIVAWATRAAVVTVQIDADTLSYARGRGEPKWVTARWADLRSAVTKSRTYRGARREWLEVEFPDGKKRIIRDPKAREVVLGLYARFHYENAGYAR